MLSLALNNIGQAALACGDTPRAILAYQEALDLALGIDVPLAIASAMSGSAAVAAARGDHVGAAQLLGATEIIREASHQDRVTHFAQHTEAVQCVRSALGEVAFATAWSAGRALSIEEAINLPRILGPLEANTL